MRRVLSNWVFRSEEQLLHRAVVVLCDEYVGHYYQLEDDDMPMAEWLGGIIFLTAKEDVVFPELVTLPFIKKMLLCEDEMPCYAYHIQGIDIYSDIPFSSSLITRLEDDGDY